jgi:hypothetical protein
MPQKEILCAYNFLKNNTDKISMLICFPCLTTTDGTHITTAATPTTTAATLTTIGYTLSTTATTISPLEIHP